MIEWVSDGREVLHHSVEKSSKEVQYSSDSSLINGLYRCPVTLIDPNGDSPAHVAAAIIGAGINVYNNWGSIVKNPWSTIGYAGTGAIAGAAGGAALAAKITAVGNLYHLEIDLIIFLQQIWPTSSSFNFTIASAMPQFHSSILIKFS